MTNLDIQNAYLGLDQVDRVYLGEDIVWPSGPEPEIDPMFWEPLTIEIENTATTPLYLVFQGGSGGTRRDIYFNKNGGPFELTHYYNQGNNQEAGHIDDNAYQGNVYQLFGASSAAGGYGFGTGTTDGSFHFFGSTQYLYGKVYGNIKSLLTDKDTWDALVANRNKAGIDNIPMSDRAFMNLFQHKSFTFNEDATYHLVLPDTNLSTNCFKGLFNNCARMVTAPALPATELASSCYTRMFSGCTSLTASPVLPALALSGACYQYMFAGCSSLSQITCLAKYINPNTAGVAPTNNWLAGVASSGTFIKHPDMANWRSGTSYGIPNGWTVQDYVVPNNS